MGLQNQSVPINFAGNDIELNNLTRKELYNFVRDFICVKESLPEVGQTVDIYIQERNEWVRICDVVYLGEFEDKFKKHDVLNVFRYEDFCGWTEDDISQEYTIQNDNIVYWSEISYPE